MTMATSRNVWLPDAAVWACSPHASEPLSSPARDQTLLKGKNARFHDGELHVEIPRKRLKGASPRTPSDCSPEIENRTETLARMNAEADAPALGLLIGSKEGAMCPICLCTIEEAGGAVLQWCMHQFCAHCIEEWNQVRRLCPLCKAEYRGWYHDVQSNSKFRERILPPIAESSNREAGMGSRTRKRRQRALSASSPQSESPEKKVEGEVISIQNRLKGLFTQVWDENGIFQRIMYKNKNQHRRTVYFRRLLQVRRDLLLLESFSLNDVVETLPHCFSFSRQKPLPPKAVLDRLRPGLQSKEQLILTLQRRLLGAARLLQMMANPLLDAGLAIEGLLSQSFFMPFALTVLALLARLRVLLTKALYDLIVAYNLVSASVKKMEIPSVQRDMPLFLECRWDDVKLVFLEKAPPPPELMPLPSSLSDAEKLPDVGWFIDDRSTSLQNPGVWKPALYEREKSFILEGCQLEVLGEEAAIDAAGDPMSTELSSGIHERAQSCSADVSADLPDAVSTRCSSKQQASTSSSKQRVAQDLDSDVRAQLESWKAELESWGSKDDKVVDKSKKKRVAYVAVELGGSKKSKIRKTGHRT